MLAQAALAVGADGRFRVRLAGGRRSPDPEEFRRLYLGGVKMVLICRRLGFSRECLRKLRGRLGLPPRGRAACRTIRYCGPKSGGPGDDTTATP
jgi:hypothetical protein